MKRQQFEDLLFAQRKLNAREKRDLHAYLQSHPQAKQFQANWLAVHSMLSDASQIAPQKGFADRWSQRLQQDLKRRERQQALWAALFGLSSIAALIAFLFSQTDSMFGTLKNLAFTTLSEILKLNTFIQIMLKTTLSILQKFPPAWWVAIAAAMFLLPLLWVATYRELSVSKGVVS